MSVELRPIQLDAMDRVRGAFNSGAQSVLLQAVTGYGKTVVASAIFRKAMDRGNRSLFLVHQDILIRQMSNKLHEFDVPHGIIKAGFTPNHHCRIQVASVQTMVKRIKKFRYEFELICIDEAHRSVSQSYRDVLAAIPGHRLLGITGTPQRLDGRGLGSTYGGLYDTLITTESVGQMIEIGYLVRPVYYASREKLDLSKVKMRMGDYDEVELAGVVDTPVITGSAVEHYRELAMGLPALTWCVNVSHAEHTAAQFNAAGIPSIVLTGESSADEREKGLAKLARREVLNVCFAQLLIEGVDVPSLRCLIFLRPTQSLTAYLQVCGRGLRIDPFDVSKNSCVILDHAGLAFVHGLCNEDREWSLEGRDRKKKKPVDSLKLMQCTSCYLIFEPHELVMGGFLGDQECCPACGQVMEKRKREGPQTVDGKLEEITADMAARLRKARQREVAKAETLEEFEAIGNARGYDKNWAPIQYGFRKRAKERAAEKWGLDQQQGLPWLKTSTNLRSQDV